MPVSDYGKQHKTLPRSGWGSPAVCAGEKTFRRHGILTGHCRNLECVTNSPAWEAVCLSSNVWISDSTSTPGQHERSTIQQHGTSHQRISYNHLCTCIKTHRPTMNSFNKLDSFLSCTGSILFHSSFYIFILPITEKYRFSLTCWPFTPNHTADWPPFRQCYFGNLLFHQLN